MFGVIRTKSRETSAKIGVFLIEIRKGNNEESAILLYLVAR